MSWHPNSNKHKREHGGYKEKPTRGQVNALMGMYAGISKVQLAPVRKELPGIQLTIKF